MGRPYIDETGHKYGRLTVLRMATEQEYQRGQGCPIYWLCQCECGKLTFAQGRSLRNGKKVSCGCIVPEKAKELAYIQGKKNAIDLTGKQFGRLKAIKYSTRPQDLSDRNLIWECECSCGNITYVRTNYLLSGHTQSCGCLKVETFQHNFKSKGESLISSILKTEHIVYEQEKSFVNDQKVKYYRFDFYLPNQQICIEFQGEQHYHYSQFFHKTKSDFTKAQERDRRKVNFCLANNISLYCIPYWEIDNIHTFADLTTERFHATTQYHNDIVWREHQKRK